MKENPNVKVNIISTPDYGPNLKTRMQSNTPPTVFNIGGPSDVKEWSEKYVIKGITDGAVK